MGGFVLLGEEGIGGAEESGGVGDGDKRQTLKNASYENYFLGIKEFAKLILTRVGRL